MTTHKNYLSDTTQITNIHHDNEPYHEQLDSINLRDLRLKNKQTENTIKAVQTKIHYMKQKQEKTVKKVINIKRKLTSIENVRSKTKQIRQKLIQERKKQEEERVKKTEFNKLIKDHLKYNKKIVMTLMNHKVSEQAKSFKQKNSKLQLLAHIQQDNIAQENAEKANSIRLQHLQAHQKRKIYFLDKLNQFKQIKEEKLREQMRQRQRQQQIIYDLQQKERMLLERLSVSQKFRIKCQQQYEQARKKYKSFYQASRGLTRRGNSCEQSRISEGEGKADIFIS